MKTPRWWKSIRGVWECGYNGRGCNYALSSIGLQGGDRNTQNLMVGALVGAARVTPPASGQ